VADATAEFFERIAGTDFAPVLGKTVATVRVEVEDGDRIDRWLVAIRDGEIVVRTGDGDADCVMRATKPVFDEVASGHTNAMAAALRGALLLDGDARLLVRFQRLFPAPVGMPEAASARAKGKRRS
jgi:putative sterol carrier protein